MTTFDTGRQAEAAAAAYLKRQGCAIVDQNWRTKFCEIDIIAQRANVVYFCEVKYRKTDRQGAGLDYITPKKLQQMQLAAEAWVHFFNWKGEYQLSAIEVSGDDFQITGVVKDL
jgi:Holliday junction resolvase-like predicted endonuclease